MRKPLKLGWFLAASLSLAPLGLAQVDPNSPIVRQDPALPASLPFFDARFDAQGVPLASVSAANQTARTPEALAARAAEAVRLEAEIAGLRIDDHELFATPVWVASTARMLTAVVPGAGFDARMIARSFLGRHRALFEIDPAELDVARITRDYPTKHNGVRHLTFQQQIGGIDLFGCEVKVNVTRNGELINVSSSMLPRPAQGFAFPQATLDPRDALYLAASSIGLVLNEELVPLGEPAGATRRQTWMPTNDVRADVPMTTELVYFPLKRGEIHPAWSLVLPEKGIGNTYEMIVDATDGEVLRRWNQLHYFGGTQPITMNVYTGDSPAPGSPGLATPSSTQFPFVPRQLLTINPGDVSAYSPNHWINDGGNETLGNNVDAHTDNAPADNNPDLPRPQGSPFRTFDFPLNVAQAPSTYSSAAVTQLFYLCNRYHDRLYGFGFDEVASNFQTDNFGLGGIGGDAVQADCQDGAGTNNANFSITTTDGTLGRMQMYIFTGPTPDRDGDLDADIVYHEFSHGLSQRLHGGLSGTQPQGMGEGWGDYFGVSLNAEATDDPNATYHTGGYSVQSFSGLVENYYFGIRRFPYSTDVNKFPLTYEDIDTGQFAYPGGIPISPVFGTSSPSEVHNVGEVWCNALLEARTGLWAVYGFAANDLMMQLVVDGMKLSPGNPTFLQARDGIIQADLISSGGADACTLWNAFAKRGMGQSASSPGTSSVGVVEAYDGMPLILFTYPNGIPTQLQPGAPTTFQVSVAPGLCSIQPIAGTGQLHYSINGGAFTAVAMTQTSANNYDATLPAGSCLDEYRFYVSTNTTSGTLTDPTGAPADSRLATVFTAQVDLFVDDFETNTGWVPANLGATSGDWQRGVPVNDPGWAYDPAADSDGSGQCFLTQNAAGNTDVDNGAVQLTSPTIDMSTGTVVITYDYYLNMTTPGGVDQLLVEINDNNGVGAWTTIATHTTSGGTTWRSHEIDAADLAAAGVTPTSTMKLRYTANDGGTQTIVESGLDAFRVRALVCNAVGTPFCFGDGTTATACPCGNVGLPGRGCENSAATGGAQLAASGTTSPDTVVLASSGELPTVFSVFLQGDSSNASGIVFGDGVRCITGNLKRLYIKAAVGGIATAPGGGDPSITTQSANLGDPIAPGSTRYYQTHYRDPSLVFCSAPPGDTFNVSSALSIVW